MNLVLDEPVTDVSSKNQNSLRSLLDEIPNDLKNSRLPNPLSVNMSLILNSPSSQIKSNSKNSLNQTRSIHTLEAPGTLSCLIGGTVSIGEGDIDGSGNPDIFKTVIREAKEELSLDLYDELKNNKIVFYGLGRNISNLKPELYGEVLISGTNERELYQAWENAKDKEESKNLIFEDVNGSRYKK